MLNNLTKMLNFLIKIFVIILFTKFTLNSQDSTDLSKTEIQNDSTNKELTAIYEYDSKVDIIQYNESILDSLKESNEYLYNEFEIKEEFSLFEWLWWKFKRMMNEIFSTLDQYGILEILITIAILIIAALIAYKYSNNSLNLGFKSRHDKILSNDMIINIKQGKYDSLIDNAKKIGNANEVIRLYFLKIISNLNYQGIIQYSEDKTNRDYYYEIKSNNIKQQFKSVTNIFDFSFYGEFDVSINQLQEFEPLFIKIISEIEGNK